VRVGDAYYLMKLKERRESRIPELSEVREKVERDYRKEKAHELAEGRAAELIKEIEGGRTLQDVAAADSLEVKDTEPFSRRSGMVPGLGAVRGLGELAFQTRKDGDILPRPFLQEDKAYVFVRKSFVPADRAEFDEGKEHILEGVRRQQEQAATEEFVRGLKERMRVSYNEALLDRYTKK
jgi:peptidyl-prolyl cis-trans isomerase D